MFGLEIKTRLHTMLQRLPVPKRVNDTPQSTTRVLFCEVRVQARSYSRPNPKWKFAIVVRRNGRLHYQVRTDDDVIWTRHLDQFLAAPQMPQQ